MSGLSEPNPYVGPRSIQQGEPLYGRREEVHALYCELQARRIVVLHSPSGAGKSSLVQAGLIPRLHQEKFDVWTPIRVNLDPTGLEGVPEGTNRYLLSAMLSLEQELPEGKRRSPAELSGMDFATYLQTRPRRKKQQGRPVVLLFDQLEEVLTVAPRAVEAKRAFFTAVGQALATELYWALFIIREDYLAAFAPYRDRIPTGMANTLRLDLLGLSGAREAALQPALAGGRVFPAVDLLIRDLSTTQVQQADGSFVAEQGLYVEPVQLQVVCRRLWAVMPADDRSIDEQDVERYAQVSDSLAGYYAQVVADVADGDVAIERAIREWVGDELIVGGIRSQVRQAPGKSGGLDNALIQGLLDSYLVRTEQRAGANWFELSHDRLVEPVQQDNERWEEEHLHPLQVQAKLWENGRRPAALLLGAGGLPEAQTWAKDHAALLTEGEQEFLEQSRALRAKERAAGRMLVALAISAVLVAMVVAVLGVVAWLARTEALEAEKAAVEARDDAREATKRAEALKERALAVSLIAGAGEQLGVGQRSRAALLLAAVKEPEHAQRWASIAQAILTTSWFPESTRMHEGGVGFAAWNHDGTRFVTACDDGKARVWNVDGSGEPLVLEGHRGRVVSVVWSPDSTRIVTASDDRTARVWNADGSPREPILEGHGGRVNSAGWSPDGARIVTASVDQTVRIWHADGSGEPLVLEGHEDAVFSAAWSPDGARIVTASADETARIWVVDGSDEPLVLEGHEDTVFSAAWSPDGTQIVTASADETVRVWNADGSGEPLVLEGHEDAVFSAGWSPDGTQIVTASTDNTVRVWKATDGGRPIILVGHSDSVISAAWSPDSQHIVSASADHTARVWNDKGSGELITLAGHSDSFTSVAWSPNGRRIATAAWDFTARVSDMERGGRAALEIGRHTTVINSVAWDPSGGRIVTASGDETARVWNADGSGEPILTLEGHTDAVNAAAWSPKGTGIVTASADGTARVWNADGLGEPIILAGHEDAVFAAAWSPDGTRIVTASADETARVWNADGSGEPIILEGHTHALLSAAWSPDGTRIVTASVDRMARVWSVDDWNDPIVLHGHSDRVTAAAWSPDSTRIVTSSWDKTARVWNADGSGYPIVLEGHQGFITSTAWSPDGTRIATASADNTARVWPIDEIAELEPRIREVTTDCLDPEDHETYFAESEDDAQQGYEACERSHGRMPP